MKQQQTITGRTVSFYTVPTDAPEADGNFSWDSTSMVLVQLDCGDVYGLGYTYADAGTAALTDKLLHSVVLGCDPMRHAETRQKMLRQIRNLGETGIAMMAGSAIDNALWDLHARLLDAPLVSVLGKVRTGIPVYGSGGFTTYTGKQLTEQLGGWAQMGFAHVKMKVGTDPVKDPARVRTARTAIGENTNLFVDANGAYTVTQAIALAHVFAESGVRWFEEPVSSDHLVGLSQVRQRAPMGMDIAAGEYGYTAWYFQRMIASQAVTVLQADCTRCGGISGFMEAAALCWAHNLPLSSHCGPSMHLHVCCAAPRAVHMDFFHDLVRIERMFFDGFVEPVAGSMQPDLSRPGMGLIFKQKDAKTILQALLPLLKRKKKSFLEKSQERMKSWNKLMEERGIRKDMPIKPRVATYTLNKLLKDDTIVSSDSGTIATWTARYVEMRGTMQFSLSGSLATMANGLPYSVGAAIAYPGRQVVCAVGDGGLAMLMGELATLVKYKLRVCVIVIKNDVLGQIKWEQMILEGNAEFGVELQPINFEKAAEAVGLRGFTINRPEEAEGVLRAALDHDGPTLVQAVVDPNEPPMPGKITTERAYKFVKSLARGQKDAMKIIKDIGEDKLREVI